MYLLNNATGGSLVLQNNTGPFNFANGGGTSRMYIDGSGNVGIGTTSPATLLDVNGAAQFGAGAVKSTFSVTTGGLTFAAGYAPSAAQDAATKGYVDSAAGGGWTRTAPVVSLSNSADNVVVQSTLTVQGNAFSVGGSALVVASGNVGIGTAAPGNLLQVSGASAGQGDIRIGGTNADGRVQIVSNLNGSNDASYLDAYKGSNYKRFEIDASPLSLNRYSMGNVGISTGDPQALFTVGNGTLTVTAAGNVGVGTASPTTKLHVVAGAGSPFTLQKASGFTGNFYQTFMNSAGSAIGYVGYTGGGTDDFSITNAVGGANLTLNSTPPGNILINQSGGNVGVGVTSGGAIYRLSVADNSASVAEHIEQDGTGDLFAAAAGATERFRITNAGKVGIGIVGPANKLDVGGTGADIGLHSTSYGTDGLLMLYNTAGVNTFQLGPGNAADTFLWTPAGDLVFDPGNSEKMRISGGGNVGIGTASPTAPLHIRRVLSGGSVELLKLANEASALQNAGAKIGFYSGDPAGSGSYGEAVIEGYQHDPGATGGGLRFYTSNPSTALMTEALTIIQNQNVGIGTDSPGSKLDVFNDSSHDITMGLGAQVSGRTSIHLVGGSTAGGLDIVDNGRLWLGTQNASNLAFGTNNADQMTILPSGNVGIGMTPVYKLDVAGQINTNTGVSLNGALYTNPDYVFEPGYKLMPLGRLRAFVASRKHLPHIPSTREVKKKGVEIFEQNRVQLENLEEAYLYIFQLQDRFEEQEGRLTAQQKEIGALRAELERMSKR